MDTTEFNKTPNIIEEHTLQDTLQIRGVADSIPLHQNKKSLRNIFLEDDNFLDIEDAEVFYPSKMNDNSPNNLANNEVDTKNLVQPFLKPKSEKESKPFVVANTTEIELEHLKQDCIIPVFSKDNEKTIAHQEFIDVVFESVSKLFPYQSVAEPEIRVSHQIKGRTPDAIHKNAKDLLEHEKTIYYERMAFIVKIPSIKHLVNGNEISLCVGGVRSYNQENLYNKKTLERFKFFIGFQNFVCMNLCVSSDGFVEDLRVSNAVELQSKAIEVMQNYNAELHLMEMKELSQDYLSEHQFAQLIGKSRLYQHLPKLEKSKIPFLNFNDSHINTMAKDYYEDKNFSRLEDGRINLWDVYNLFTQANKSSYIDTFLDRNLNAFEFSKGIQKTLNGSFDYHWFLS
ncbi:DUF3871 family protein [Epilithonimonas vandammei]|uniref:DUF3871 family protein n=1 Tax=Epilithonimonas vandammei TaxID=2487072 RepID=A0A3G8Y0E1_9FLAO|nr:DUF3871 family protein [Epilithonimonas vandammei]AZI38809.1 DUF3871 family protein [Epilithonimonas vandammei]AZI53963.1 DUF3871 family protein [Epilithonimonas vandammei]